MKHIKTIKEYLDPVIKLTKDELGLGIQENDELLINNNIYYFLRIEDNTIYVSDENGEEFSFELDELNDNWEITRVNDQDIVVEKIKN
jgi:hypothetical protein